MECKCKWNAIQKKQWTFSRSYLLTLLNNNNIGLLEIVRVGVYSVKSSIERFYSDDDDDALSYNISGSGVPSSQIIQYSAATLYIFSSKKPLNDPMQSLPMIWWLYCTS